MGTVAGHALSTFTTPVNATSPIDANEVRGNDNTVKIAYNAHDADATIHLQNGAVATRPVAATAGVGAMWLATDTDAQFVWYTDGASWIEIDYVRNTGGTITGAVTISTGGLTVTAGGQTITAGNLGIGVAQQTNIALTVFGVTSGVAQIGISSDPSFASDAVTSGKAITARVRTAVAAFTMVDAMGIHVAGPVKGAGSAITNLYGIKVDDQTAGATLNYAIFTGAGLVRFGDQVLTPASTATRAGLFIASGTAPSAPVSGEFWYDGTNLKFRDGGTTRTITWV